MRAFFILVWERSLVGTATTKKKREPEMAVKTAEAFSRLRLTRYSVNPGTGNRGAAFTFYFPKKNAAEKAMASFAGRYIWYADAKPRPPGAEGKLLLNARIVKNKTGSRLHIRPLNERTRLFFERVGLVAQVYNDKIIEHRKR